MAFHVVRINPKARPPKPPPQAPNIILMDTPHEDEYNHPEDKQFPRREAILSSAVKKSSSTNLPGPPSSKKRKTSYSHRKSIVLLDPNIPIKRFGDERVDFYWPSYTLIICLIVCAILQGVLAIAAVTVWFNLYFVWPLHFMSGLHPLSFLFRNKWIALVFAFEPLYKFAMLIVMVFVLGRKKHHLIRVFCWISVWLLILLTLIIANCIYLLTTLTIERVNQNLLSAMELYYKDPPYMEVHDEDMVARKGWDELQYYFRCCGIFNVHDWGSIISHESEGVPHSCCRSTAVCQSEDVERTAMAWSDGCYMKTYELFEHAGRVVLIVAICSFIVGVSETALTTYFARLRYVSAMRKADNKFHYPTTVLLSDVFGCGLFKRLCKCKCCHRRNKVTPQTVTNPIYAEEYYSLPKGNVVVDDKHRQGSLVVLYENKNFQD